MELVKELVKEELICLECPEETLVDFFEDRANYFQQRGYVKESFCSAIINREVEYPTGLQLEHIAIAIPHTDPVHICKPFISINKLKKETIQFIQMGTSDIGVYPKFIFVLGITHPKEQVELLSQLMELFSNKDFVESLMACSTSEEIKNLFN